MANPITKEKAIHNFWNEFLTAYEENSVPDSAKMPYITYELITDCFTNTPTYLTASIWYRDSSWKSANAMADKISTGISRGGRMLQCSTGAIWINRASPFATRRSANEDDRIRRIVLNITAEFVTAD